ncbi:MAG: homoserine O-succinyltransferase [Gammaproteobacteria bacterium]|nr:MAG: homoserine O-succinyltransferase [Gammaproteobacteria bacterium]
MPIIAQNNHPSIHRVAREGFEVISAQDAKHQDIRELHIGFLNMMPDAAFLATERQFFRLTAASTNIVQIYIHPIRCEGVDHNTKITQHIDEYYQHFDCLKKEGLDAVIVTGANPQFTDLTKESYWSHATDIFSWAEKNVCSVFYSCLASHAVLQAQYGLTRTPLAEKLWGVYSHRVVEHRHPLVANINTRFDMPHSRHNDIESERLIEKSLKVLAMGEKSGVAIATSRDGFRQIFCQGHPEYDRVSILKEYKREIQRFLDKERDYPAFPYGYVTLGAKELLTAFKKQLVNRQTTLADFPDEAVLDLIDNTWRDTAKAIFSNWLGLVYRVTHVDRTKAFMDGIDPDAPLAKWYNRDLP